jgi:hypothetical protein
VRRCGGGGGGDDDDSNNINNNLANSALDTDYNKI